MKSSACSVVPSAIYCNLSGVSRQLRVAIFQFSAVPLASCQLISVSLCLRVPVCQLIFQVVSLSLRVDTGEFLIASRSLQVGISEFKVGMS